VDEPFTWLEFWDACHKILHFGAWYWVPMTVFLAGFLGSFINVCIWRIPRGLSLAFIRSHCTSCRTALGPRDLIPVLSYLVLMRGRCRHCHAPVPARYLSVELWTISHWLLAYALFGPGSSMVLMGAMLSVALACLHIRKQFASRGSP
jgi:leader peptidase (prepilin peptidase)/N-methyltransferase